jgi:hypothetical protein
MIFGAALGATLARSTVTPAFAALAAASPTPNAPDHRHGGGLNGHPCGGHSNEDAAHEKTETPAEEAAENAACPSPAASPAASR